MLRAGRPAVSAEVELTVPLFIGAASPPATQSLARALTDVAADAVKDGIQRHVPVHVSLPDPVVRCDVFEFDRLPRRAADRTGLVRQRFGTPAACAWQHLGRRGGRHRLLGLAIDHEWHRCLVAAFREAGVVPWTLAPDVCRQFNRHRATLRVGHAGGALVVVSAHTWSLLVFDEDAKPCHVTSRWRTADDEAQIAAAVERCIVSVVQQTPGLVVRQVHVVATVPGQTVASALDARSDTPCVHVPPCGMAHAAALSA